MERVLTTERRPALTVRGHWDDTTAIVTAKGDVDFTTIDTLSVRLAAVLSGNPQRLVIDLAEVSFLDSAGLHSLSRARKALPEGCPLVIRSPQPKVRRIFEITGLDKVFTFE